VAAASIALVIALSVVLLRRYETRVEIERLQSIVRPLALTTNIERITDETGQSPGARRLRTSRLDDQAAELDVRLIVLDASGTVAYDTAAGSPLDGVALDRLTALATRVGTGGGERRQIALGPRSSRSPFPGKVVIASTVRGSDSGDLLILVSSRDRFPLLRRALWPLALITAAALVVAVGTGLLLSRRIARPVERLTDAIDAMDTGGLEQRVEGDGPDELGRLVSSFNAMSARVAATSRSQRDLLANVAHELRTPLTSIHGFSRAMVDGVIRSEEDRGRALATIDREAERMTALIGELLDLARLEAGAVTLDRTSVSVSSLLDEVVARFEARAASAGVALSADAGDDLTAWGDRGRLLQIISNLVSNALTHTPEGGRVHLVARHGRDAEGRPMAVITVSDTGAGIEPERIGRVFDRFESGETRSGSGIGLGLAIVGELVALHGGAIAVESEAGAGATFTVTLPAEGRTSTEP